MCAGPMCATRHNVRCRAPDNVPGHSQIIGPPAKQCCKGMYVCVCARAHAAGSKRPLLIGQHGGIPLAEVRGVAKSSCRGEGESPARRDPACLPHAAPTLPYISLGAVSCSSCPAVARPSSRGTLPGCHPCVWAPAPPPPCPDAAPRAPHQPVRKPRLRG